MRLLIVLLAAVVLFVLVGWISFQKGEDRSSITIETGEIREDTKEVMKSGADLLHKAGDDLEEEANKPAATPSAPPASTPAPPETATQ